MIDAARSLDAADASLVTEFLAAMTAAVDDVHRDVRVD